MVEIALLLSPATRRLPRHRGLDGLKEDCSPPSFANEPVQSNSGFAPISADKALRLASRKRTRQRGSALAETIRVEDLISAIRAGHWRGRLTALAIRWTQESRYQPPNRRHDRPTAHSQTGFVEEFPPCGGICAFPS